MTQDITSEHFKLLKRFTFYTMNCKKNCSYTFLATLQKNTLYNHWRTIPEVAPLAYDSPRDPKNAPKICQIKPYTIRDTNTNGIEPITKNKHGSDITEQKLKVWLNLWALLFFMLTDP